VAAMLVLSGIPGCRPTYQNLGYWSMCAILDHDSSGRFRKIVATQLFAVHQYAADAAILDG
jgi:hypothetical protein